MKRTFLQRLLLPTPNFFKKVQKIGLTLTALGAVIIASPVALPSVLVGASGYLVFGGSILSVFSQATIPHDETKI